MDVRSSVVAILDEILSLDGRARTFDDSEPLLGAIVELDSTAVVSIITSVEEAFDLYVEDDEVDGDAFQTLGSLVAFVEDLVRRNA